MEKGVVVFLKNVPDYSMRAGCEGVFVAIDVRDTDIEEEIYQKRTNVLCQKNLQRMYLKIVCLILSELHFANLQHSYHRPSQLWAKVSKIHGR